MSDLISRDALLAKLPGSFLVQVGYPPSGKFVVLIDDVRRAINSAPAITPALGPVTAEDVCEGIEFYDLHGCKYEVGTVAGGRFAEVWDTMPTDSSGADRGRDQRIAFPTELVAVLLNAAETITWPKGSRFYEPEREISELEAAAARVSRLLKNVLDTRAAGYAAILDDAIAAERAKRGEGV